MKALLFIAACLLLIMACTKSSVTPTPDAGNIVAGTYTILTDRADTTTATGTVTVYNYTYPIALQGGGSATGTLTARRDSATVVFVTETFKATNYSDENDTLYQMSLKSNGAGYDLYQQNQKVGSADGTNFNLDYKLTNPRSGSTYHFTTTAKRQ